MNGYLETMRAFFDRRADSYESHMKSNVKESAAIYRETAGLVPVITRIKILDLGCGTGLELDEIFRLNSTARVTGIDLSKKMLDILRSKYKNKKGNLNLIAGSYFKVEFPAEGFDVAISVQSMHHFGQEQKLSLYRKVFRSLAGNGTYIEADYVVDTAIEEMELRNRYESLKSECN
ncbi:MAG: methyltransferase domain-containing protein, partial [Kosmotogaceae bacterium]|nr:methyltransferase domain-containing protein [Kosmotogaceae bacterium]